MIQGIIAGLATFFTGWNLFQHKKIDKIREDTLIHCVQKNDCKEDRERVDKAVDEIKQIFERGFQGVHRRIDEALKKKD